MVTDRPAESPDGGADTADSGRASSDADVRPDAEPIAPDDPDAAVDDGTATLATLDGCFFDVVDIDDVHELDVGVEGTRYGWMTFEYTVIAGAWREDLFDRPVLNHGLFVVARNVAPFEGRYILGNAAQMKPAASGLDRKSVFYGRVDLEKKPAGLGYTGYTSWRSGMAWVPGETYRVHILLDAVAREQRLQLFHDGEVVATTVGPIDYFAPSLTESTFRVTFGGIESEEREVKPVGWSFCDLVVRAEPL
jgi:hypothetical protein